MPINPASIQMAAAAALAAINAAQQIMDLINRASSERMTDEQFVAAWSAMQADLRSSIARWEASQK